MWIFISTVEIQSFHFKNTGHSSWKLRRVGGMQSELLREHDHHSYLLRFIRHDGSVCVGQCRSRGVDEGEWDVLLLECTLADWK